MHTGHGTVNPRGMLLIVLMALAGCGYHLTGQPNTVPVALRSVAVLMFTNKTAVPGIERPFTAAVRERLLTDGRVTLVPAVGAAAVLRGEVTRYHLQVVATNRDDRAVEYRVEAEMRLTVEDVQQGRILVEQPVTATAEYVVSERLVSTDIARERALQAVAREAGERVVSLLLDRF